MVAKTEKKERKPKVDTFLVTKRKPVPTNRRPAAGIRGARTKLVHEVVREVAGFAPFEKRAIELIKASTSATTKRALKLCKKRLGSHHRAMKKREELVNAVNAMKHVKH